MNNLDWQAYESITKYVYETLGQEFGIKIEGYGHNCKVIGKSGIKHQIDVLTSSSDRAHKYQTAIECKYWNRKVNKDIVMKLRGVIQDADIDKGIIVSKSGFTKDTIDFARHYNIEIVELREVGKKDPEANRENIAVAFIEIRQHITVLRPEILTIAIDYVDDVNDETEPINRYRYTILTSDGKRTRLDDYALSFQKALREQNKLFKTVTQRQEIIGGKLIDHTNQSSRDIKALEFTGILKKIKNNYNTEFKLVDQVSLIMKSIFEERTFRISENGYIIENKK
ncbi:restriction endonuclease [Niabella yanshanensis]|uniref:Restriction endonuclease n=1 Tax=Niabella yanshanensis TaxID=577386 RepID=A0ABZ0W0P6_9BACT|nr:restriction endonuclease [Niabella yanshanensis]WQD36304.1 restriction endonuclease [Niabella yanshanensis]